VPTTEWLLLLYTLPAKNNAARVSLWRKLQKTGALPFRTSAYLLPDTAPHLETFQWLAQQIRDDGGEAILVRGAEIEGRSREDLVQLFHDARATDYRALIRALANLATTGARKQPEKFAARLARFRREFEAIQRIDYFGCPLAQDARSRLEKLEQLGGARPKRQSKLNRRDFQGRTWLTRPRPQVDRVGSAWLIKRFIDARAKFVFAATPGVYPEAIPFDMVGVEFTHHGDDCTFETLLKRFALHERALGRIGEMVHNADLGDGKFAAPEGAGIDRMLRGLARQGWSDEKIFEHGFISFDALYAQLKSG
jgi:hypothetical protein